MMGAEEEIHTASSCLLVIHYAGLFKRLEKLLLVVFFIFYFLKLVSYFIQ